MGPFGLELGEFFFHGRHLLFEILLRPQAVIATKGVHAKVANEKRGKDVETECREERTASTMGNHRHKDARRPLKAALMPYMRWRNSLSTKLPRRLPRFRRTFSTP